MLQHADVWRAIDRLAAKYGLSASGLARRAGLDPTTFNRSKRVAKDGKLRWPSTESLSKILSATGASVGEFVGLLNGEDVGFASMGLRRIGYQVVSEPGFFDPAGRPIGNGWGRMPLPEMADPDAFAIEIRGSALQPTYADGHVLVVSPASRVDAGHRVIVRLGDGSILFGNLDGRGPEGVELTTFDGTAASLVVPQNDITWMSRIVWVIQ